MKKDIIYDINKHIKINKSCLKVCKSKGCGKMQNLNIKHVIDNKNDAITKTNEYLDNCIIQDRKHLIVIF